MPLFLHYWHRYQTLKTKLLQHKADGIYFSDGSYVVTDTCEVPDEFSGTQFQPSIDGLYNLQILNDADTFDISRLGQLRIQADGTGQLRSQADGTM